MSFLFFSWYSVNTGTQPSVTCISDINPPSFLKNKKESKLHLFCFFVSVHISLEYLEHLSQFYFKAFWHGCHFHFASLFHSHWPKHRVSRGFDAEIPGQFPCSQHANRHVSLPACHAQLINRPPEGSEPHQR